MQMEHIKYRLTYAEYGELVERLTLRLAKSKPTHVYGQPRGGIPIGVHVSHHLGIPLVFSEELFSLRGNGGCLVAVVDDLVDTGVTFRRLAETLTGKTVPFVTAVMFRKPWSVFAPDIYIEDTNRWIVFPWERPDDPPNR